MVALRTWWCMGLGIVVLVGVLIGPGPAARGQVGRPIPGGGIGSPGPWGVMGRTGGPTSQPATTHPVVKLDIKPVDPAKQQAEALAKVIDVNYRRDFPIEVLQDLHRRTGLRYALPGPLDKAYLFTFEAKGVTVKEVLQKLEAAGKTKGEYPDAADGSQLDLRADLAVLTRQAGDQVLADLQKKLADPDRWERIHAIWGLANLADARIYPPLVKMLADKDPGVVEWTLKGLEKHVLMAGLWPEADRNVLAEALLKRFEKEDYSTQSWMAWWWWADAVDPRWQRMRLLAATRRPQAIAALVQYLTKGQVSGWLYAAAALGEVGQAEAQMLSLMNQAKDTWETYAKQQNDKQARWQAQHAEELKQGNRPAMPNELRATDPAMFRQQVLYRATQGALIRMRNVRVLDDVLSEYLDLIRHNMAPVINVDLRQTGEPQVLELLIQPLLTAVEPLYAQDIPEPSWSVRDFFAGRALAELQNFDDPRAYQATARVVKNPAALKFVAGQWNPPTLKATDPAVLEALLTHAKETGPVGILVARSLGSSRDVRAADALIAMLKSEDKELVGEAAMALANTHDFRTLKALTDLLAQKIDWPDLEAAEMEKRQQGKAGRSVTNPRALVMMGLIASRDPAAFDALLALVNAPKADEEIDWLALAAQDAQAVEKLIAWVKQAEPANQQLMLLDWRGGMGSGSKLIAWQRDGIRQLPLRCREDGRWPGLVGARVNDDGVTVYKGDGATPVQNLAVNTLGQILTPDSELALLAITRGEDKDLAGFAAKALEAFHDPGAHPGANPGANPGTNPGAGAVKKP